MTEEPTDSAATSPVSVRRMIRDGNFPPVPVSLRNERIVWRVEEIHQWRREQLGKPRK